MNKDFKNVGVGLITLCIFGFIGLLGFSFFREVIKQILKIGIEAILENTLFLLLGIIGFIVTVTVLWIVGNYVNKNVIEKEE